MRIPKDLPSKPAHRGARWIALRLLDAAKKAALRLDTPQDVEALHDFRVSLRRLRSFLRFYRRILRPSFSKKLVRKIRKIASTTGDGRDAEVQAAYLRKWERDFSPSLLKAGAWLGTRLEERCKEHYFRSVGQAKGAFLELEPDLREALPSRRGTHPGGKSLSFSRVTGDMMLTTASRLSKHLAVIRSARDVERCHRARISGKRLRYLMEPLRERSTAWKRCVSNLKKLQDILGELHDMHVLEDEIARTTEKIAVPGLRGLAKHVRDRQRFLFRKLQRNWGETRRARFFGEVSALLGTSGGRRSGRRSDCAGRGGRRSSPR